MSLAAIFVVDINIHRGYDITPLYAVPLLLSSSRPGLRPFLLVSLIILLMFAACWLKQGPLPAHISFFNALVTGLILVCIGWLLQSRRASENALRESEALQRSILTASPNSIGIMKEGRFLWVNETMSKKLGFSREDLIGRGAGLIAPWDKERERVRRKVYETIAAEGRGSIDTCWQGRDGSRYDILLSWASVEGNDPRGRLVFVGVDIGERKKAEAEVFRQKQTFQVLAENSPDVILLFDRFKRFRYVNAAMGRYAGKPPRFFVGKSITALSLLPGVKKAWEEMFDSAVDTGEKTTCEMDFPTTIGVRTFVNNYLPVRGPNGRVESVIGFAHDVTDFKRVQAMLEKRAEEAEGERRILEVLLENIPAGILISDTPNGRVAMTSKYFLSLLGGKEKNIIGRRAEEVAQGLHASYPGGSPIPRQELAFARALEGKATLGQEQRVRLPDGKTLPILVNAAPIKDGEGRVTGAVLVWNDISKLKQAEDVLRRDKETFERLVMERTRELISAQLELEQAKRLSDIGSLAATVAHELRNPLGVIRAASFNIKRKAARHDLIEGQLANIEKKITQSDQIINNLLFYARLKRPQFERVDISQVLEESIDSFRKRFPDFREEESLRGIKGLVIDADPLQMSELFNNIISNAYDAAKAMQGHVSIEASREDSSVKFVIRDNGPGMDREQLGKIFEPFYTTKAKGTGLGLTVSRQIVALHGGALNIESEKGRGTTVTITLPREHHPAR